MPDGIMGTDLVKRLTATRADLPVIFTSGYSQESERLPSLISGVNFLQKPYRPAALIRLIRERLDTAGRKR
jgi:FixJ family two-component response regulator